MGAVEMSYLIRLLVIMVCVSAASPVLAQLGQPGPSSPLYGARPSSGNPSTGLPTALRDVRIEQKLNQQLPLDLVFRDENGQEVKLGNYFGQDRKSTRLNSSHGYISYAVFCLKKKKKKIKI